MGNSPYACQGPYRLFENVENRASQNGWYLFNTTRFAMLDLSTVLKQAYKASGMRKVSG